ncbi:MAG: triphosphoribosyl-dephospho-CoA synthetase [Fuerstiella sp.]|nr:triphosphoribosyl-dephospho-CoA synthetase [Fuerstiella sp.]MCP4856173.1 triphosphoribosyl-dephospho-CoA synthetase [Fuerstiella sp.]
MSEWESRVDEWVRQACVAEVSAEKPGNVTPAHGFDDVSYQEFVQSAQIIAPIVAAAGSKGVGRTICEAVKATRAAVDHNTNLGIVLLLTPLAAVPQHLSIADGIESVLAALTVQDAEFAYEAIRTANPGGLGSADSEDVTGPASQDLRSCMQLAADRDMVAAQYANGFHDVLNACLPLLRDEKEPFSNSSLRIGWLATHLLARYGDSLIRRKCGVEIDMTVRAMAAAVLAAGWPNRTGGDAAWHRLDRFLRADGNRRNPGTTADLVAATLFVALRNGEGVINPQGQIVFPQ